MNEQSTALEDGLAYCALLAFERAEMLRAIGHHSEARKMDQVVSTIESLWETCEKSYL